MSEIQIASRYVKALMNLAQDRNVLDSIKHDMEWFISICRVNLTLLTLLKNPVVSLHKKIAILDSVFENKLDALVLSFFRMMIEKGRSDIVYTTVKKFVYEYDLRKNIVKTTITSAVILTEDNKEKIRNAVWNMTKSEAILFEYVDPKLIAGFVLKVGDIQLDTSLLSQLQRLKKEFIAKKIT